MIFPTTAGPLGEGRAISTAGGGTALSTTPAFIQIPAGVKHLALTPRNFTTAVVAQLIRNPWLVVLKTADDLATVTEYSDEAQDASTATSVVLSSLGTAAQGDYLFVGSHKPFRGVAIDVDGPNSNASVLTVRYPSLSNLNWFTISATDGTASGGVSLAQDGNVTWTDPADDWLKLSLVQLDTELSGGQTPGATVKHRTAPLYWTRWEWSAALDSAVTLDHMLAMNRSTVYEEYVSGQTLELQISRGVFGDGCLEARVDAGTGNLVVNGYALYGERGLP